MSLIVTKYREFCQKNNIQIKPHQVYGVIWCLLHEYKPLLINPVKSIRGGILADEMGMGKTIQMIGVLMLNPKQKTLIIVPPILIQQWYREILKYTGHKSVIYHGKNRKQTPLEDAMVVITSYDVVFHDSKDGIFPSHTSIFWNRIICDEAHHLRNPTTKIYHSISSLLYQARNNGIVLWCITGTPVQNSMRDLYTLFSLFCPQPMTVNTLSSSSGPSLNKKHTKEYDEILRSSFLQRKQRTLLEKQETETIVEWKNEEERYLATDIHHTIPCLKFGMEMETDDSFWKEKKAPILVSMLRAKQTCILPKMVEIPYFASSLKKIEETQTKEIPEKILHCFQDTFSSKLSEILNILRERKSNGNGKILFCHFRAEIAFLKRNLQEEITDSWVGEWSDYKKMDSLLLDKMGESPILILPIQSGCEGLNLQDRFSEIYFVSPNWNPAMEAQAIARCHRIGQKKIVQVFRFSMNRLDTPERNDLREQDIQIYLGMKKRLPDDIFRLINDFALPGKDPIYNTSLDQYITKIQKQKQEKIKTGLYNFMYGSSSCKTD
jgi:SNF2 family DNA or RNA helicase